MFALALLIVHCPEPTPVEPAVSRVAALVAALKGKDRKARWDAIEQLGKMGPAASDAVPDLIELMDEQDEETRWGLCSVLREIGPKSVPPLVRALGSREPARRRHAVEALSEIAKYQETAVAPAVPALTAVAVGDTDREARLFATGAIARTRCKEAVTALLIVLKKQDDPEVRLSAAEGLRYLGDLAKPALPAFLELMDEEGEIEVVARQALQDFGDADAAAGLAKILDNTAKGGSARGGAAEALSHMPSQSAIAIPALIRACQDPDAELRGWVADCLRKIGTEARDAAPALKEMLSDASPKVRIAAASALYAVRGSDDPAVKCLVSESLNPDYSIRAKAVYRLGVVGKKENVAVDAVIASLADEEPSVRIEAAEALKAVGRPAAAKAIPALEKLLDDPFPEVSAAAKKALSGLRSKMI